MSEWRADPAWPAVDVIMPIRNEAPHLDHVLTSIKAQRYPGALRVFMAIGPSGDGTEAVADELAATDDEVIVIANPHGTIPRALNLAIRAGTAPVIVRVDGHSELHDGYIIRAVETLRRTGAANVGGHQSPVADSVFQAAVAAATTSWLGTGGAAYRVGGTETPVDTVYLGVFDRSAIETVGLYDEHLLRNEDYELNIRLRKAGYDVLFDPELAVSYSPRRSWTALARQYYEYGVWKAEVLRMHPDSLRFRQAIAPLGILTVAVSLAAAVRRPLLGVPAAGYALVVAASAAQHRDPGRTAAVQVVIHVSWTVGLLRGAVPRRTSELLR